MLGGALLLTGIGIGASNSTTTTTTVAFEGKLDNPITIQVKVRAWDATAYFGG